MAMYQTEMCVSLMVKYEWHPFPHLTTLNLEYFYIVIFVESLVIG